MLNRNETCAMFKKLVFFLKQIIKMGIVYSVIDSKKKNVYFVESVVVYFS